MLHFRTFCRPIFRILGKAINPKSTPNRNSIMQIMRVFLKFKLGIFIAYCRYVRLFGQLNYSDSFGCSDHKIFTSAYHCLWARTGSMGAS